MPRDGDTRINGDELQIFWGGIWRTEDRAAGLNGWEAEAEAYMARVRNGTVVRRPPPPHGTKLEDAYKTRNEWRDNAFGR